MLEDDVALDFDRASFSDAVVERLDRDTEVTIGIRPDAVNLDSNGKPAKVFVNQWLGDQTHIAAEFAGGSIVSVEHQRLALTEGEIIGITIAAQDLHIFESSGGRAISHGGQLNER